MKNQIIATDTAEEQKGLFEIMMNIFLCDQFENPDRKLNTIFGSTNSKIVLGGI